MDRIEDKVFASALKATKLRRTKSMYERDCRCPHTCKMCLEYIEEPLSIFKLKPEFVTDYNTPYLFICSDCFDELPND